MSFIALGGSNPLGCTKKQVVDVMKCCKCGKEIDVSKHVVMPEWFGAYRGSELMKVICVVCIKKPENRENWSRD